MVPRGGLSGLVLATGSICSGIFLENSQASLLELPAQQMALGGSSRHLSLLVPSFPREAFLVNSIGFAATYVLSHPLLAPPLPCPGLSHLNVAPGSPSLAPFLPSFQSDQSDTHYHDYMTKSHHGLDSASDPVPHSKIQAPHEPDLGQLLDPAGASVPAPSPMSAHVGFPHVSCTRLAGAGHEALAPAVPSREAASADSRGRSSCSSWQRRPSPSDPPSAACSAPTTAAFTL